jgi:uncharacterized RDD family membrane protein YckC
MNEPAQHQPGPVSGGFVSRAAAFVLDAILMSTLFAIAASFVQLMVDFFRIGPRDQTATLVYGAGLVALVALLQLLYFVVFWSLLGQTPGKILLGLRIVRGDGRRLSAGRALVRYLGYWLSAIPLGLGFLWVLVDRRRRAWHDILADTVVVFTHDSAAYHMRVASAKRRGE